MQNYTGYGWEGRRYDRDLDITEIATIIRQELKSAYPACTFSVRTERYAGGQALHVSLMAAPFAAFKDIGQFHEQVNHYYLNEYKDDETLTLDAFNCMKLVRNIVQVFNYDDSDAQIDYFNTNFYLHLNIGQWNKPFKLKEVKE